MTQSDEVPDACPLFPKTVIERCDLAEGNLLALSRDMRVSEYHRGLLGSFAKDLSELLGEIKFAHMSIEGHAAKHGVLEAVAKHSKSAQVSETVIRDDHGVAYRVMPDGSKRLAHLP